MARPGENLPERESIVARLETNRAELQPNDEAAARHPPSRSKALKKIDNSEVIFTQYLIARTSALNRGEEERFLQKLQQRSRSQRS